MNAVALHLPGIKDDDLWFEQRADVQLFTAVDGSGKEVGFLSLTGRWWFARLRDSNRSVGAYRTFVEAANALTDAWLRRSRNR